MQFILWLSYAARRTLVTRPEVNPRPALGVQNLNHWTPREVLQDLLFYRRNSSGEIRKLIQILV